MYSSLHKPFRGFTSDYAIQEIVDHAERNFNRLNVNTFVRHFNIAKIQMIFININLFKYPNYVLIFLVQISSWLNRNKGEKG